MITFGQQASQTDDATEGQEFIRRAHWRFVGCVGDVASKELSIAFIRDDLGQFQIPAWPR